LNDKQIYIIFGYKLIELMNSKM